MADEQPSRHPYAYTDAVPAPLAYIFGAALAVVRLACLLLGAVFYVTCARAKTPRRALTRFAMGCFGVLSLTVDDRREKGEEAPIVVLAPHHGLLEGLFAAYYFDGRPMMMATFAKLPVIGAIVRANGALLVELKRHATKVTPADAPKPSHAARQALATHAAEFKGGRPVAVLPEGTTHNGASLLKFFDGAFAPLAPVQPVCVRYSSACLDGSFCGTLTSHLARLLCAPYQRMRVVILPAIRPLDGEDAPAFASRVRAEMASELDVPLSEYDAKSLNAEYVARRRPK